ncbi:MAG: hypothetical protein ACRDYX_15920 [Egibacteraceae bacterium]
MIRRIAVLMAVLTLASATSALAEPSDKGTCTIVKFSGEARDKRANPQGIDDPGFGLCEILRPQPKP